MKQRAFFLLGVAVACALTLAVSASATHSSGQGPAKDLVAGTARIAGFNNPLVHVNAHRNVETDDVRGHFFVRYPPPFDARFGGDVVCMNVVGTGAAVLGVVDNTSGIAPFAVPIGQFVNVRVLDLGEPGTLDRANFDFNASCSGVGDLAVSSGNYVVHQGFLDLSPFSLLLSSFETAAGDH